MWAAYFQADGEMRYTIAVTKFRHTAEFERDEFVKRMTHPNVAIWFTWIEKSEDTDGSTTMPTQSS